VVACCEGFIGIVVFECSTIGVLIIVISRQLIVITGGILIGSFGGC